MTKFELDYDITTIDPDAMNRIMRDSRDMRARYLKDLCSSAVAGIKTIARESLGDLNQAIGRVGELTVGTQDNLIHKK